MKKIFYLIIIIFSNLANGLTLSIPMYFENGIPVVDLKLNDKNLTFMLDSGTTYGVHLIKEIAEKTVDLTYIGKKTKTIDIGGKIQESSEFIIPKANINGMLFSNLKGLIFTPWGLNLGKKAVTDPNVSVIGLGVFSQKMVEINMGKKILVISDGTDQVFNEKFHKGRSIPFERVDEGIVIVLSSKNTSYRMILDTAATISMVKTSVAEKNDVIETCDFDLGSERACKFITVGLSETAKVKPLLIDFPENFSADGILGSDFFLQHTIFLDLKNKYISIIENT